MPRLATLTAVLLAALVTGCSQGTPAAAVTAAPASSRATAAAVPAGAKPTLAFFMNPNGRPCQMQDDILHAMPDLAARAEVVRYKTTEPGDIARFEQYGIRSLPQLVLLDSSGAVLRRPTPGILSDPQVRQLLAP